MTTALPLLKGCSFSAGSGYSTVLCMICACIVHGSYSLFGQQKHVNGEFLMSFSLTYRSYSYNYVDFHYSCWQLVIAVYICLYHIPVQHVMFKATKSTVVCCFSMFLLWILMFNSTFYL